MGIAKLNVGSNFKIDGDSNDSKTKEYWHKFAFNSLQKYIEHKLKSLQQEGGLQWTTKQNQWQIGNMTSYAWCSIFPLNAPTKAALALHVSAYSDGSIATGFLPDWKDGSVEEASNEQRLLNLSAEKRGLPCLLCLMTQS